MNRLVLIAALFLVGPLSTRAAVIDDFNDGDDAGWTHVDLLSLTGVGATDYDASSQAYHLRSMDTLPQLNEACNGGGSFWTQSFSDTTYLNGTIRATVRMETEISSVLIGMRTETTGDGYSFALNNVSDRIFLDRLVGYVGLEGGLASIPFDVTPGVDYLIEGTAIGSNLSLKVWRVGEDEPAEPQLVAVDDTYSSGAVWLATYYCANGPGGELSASFDDVSFAVPEPTSFVLAAMLVTGIVVARRFGRLFSAAAMVALAVASLASPVHAKPIFFDNFDDRSFSDGAPASWAPLPMFSNGSFSAATNDFVLSGDGSGLAIVAYVIEPSDDYSDISLQTQVRSDGPADGVALFARLDENALVAYQGGIDSDGNAYIGWNDPTYHGLAATPTSLRVAEDDVVLRFDVFGDTLSLFAWHPSEPKPQNPLVQVADQRFATGGIGILNDPQGATSATFRFVQASTTPEPSSMALAALLLAPAFITFRRRTCQPRSFQQ